MWMLAVGLAGLGSAAFAWPVARGARAVPFAAGLLVTGLSAGAAAIAETLAPHAVVVDVPLAVEIPLVGLFLAVGAYLLGLLTPGERRGAEARPLVRLRTWLEGASFAICTLYTVWLLVIGPAGMRGASVTASLLGSLALGTAAASATRMLWPAAGVMLSIAGLTALILALDYRGTPVVTAAAALALLAAGPLIRYGSRAPGYPLLALPLVGSALATGYQLIHHRSLDTVAVGLAVATIVTVATREWLATTALRRYADHLAAQGEQLRALVLGAGEMALILDGRLMVRWQSPAAARQFGLSDQDVVGQPVTALVHPDDAGRCAAYLADPGEQCELRLRDGFGAYRETEWRCGGPDPARPGWSLVVHVRDVSQRRELERTLRRARYADRLTGLANRQGLRRAGEPRSGSGALMVIDLYGLTGVSDLHGPELGDAVLVEAARRLRTEVGESDVPARVGEGRFAVLTPLGAVQAHVLASRLLTILSAPYSAPGARAHLSATAGLADLTVEADFDEVLRRAELALRATRPGGTDAVEWYDEAMEARLIRRSALEQELPGAVERGQLDLAYQPIVELATGRPVGAEALLRWRHPALGTVPPAELVPVAHELGVLPDIGGWVLHRACRQLSSWTREGRDLFMSVNVCAHELAAPDFVADVVAALETHLVPATSLVVEVAEPQLVAVRQDPAARSVFEGVLAHLAELRTLGVRAAVDNFGIGPTSLSQLRVLPLDLLKIDRLVFAPDGPGGPAGAIIDVLVKLGGQLGIEVLAQGLETPSDLDVARAAGCRYGQGYLWSQPVPSEHLEAYLDQHRVG